MTFNSNHRSSCYQLCLYFMVFYSHNYLNYTENLYIRHTAIIQTMTFETIFSMMDKRYVDSAILQMLSIIRVIDKINFINKYKSANRSKTFLQSTYIFIHTLMASKVLP